MGSPGSLRGWALICTQNLANSRWAARSPSPWRRKENRGASRSAFAVAITMCPAAALPRAKRVCSPTPPSPRGTRQVAGRVCSG